MSYTSCTHELARFLKPPCGGVITIVPASQIKKRRLREVVQGRTAGKGQPEPGASVLNHCTTLPLFRGSREGPERYGACVRSHGTSLAAHRPGTPTTQASVLAPTSPQQGPCVSSGHNTGRFFGGWGRRTNSPAARHLAGSCDSSLMSYRRATRPSQPAHGQGLSALRFPSDPERHGPDPPL